MYVLLTAAIGDIDGTRQSAGKLAGDSETHGRVILADIRIFNLANLIAKPLNSFSSNQFDIVGQLIHIPRMKSVVGRKKWHDLGTAPMPLDIAE
jgi:hypothetical protein